MQHRLARPERGKSHTGSLPLAYGSLAHGTHPRATSTTSWNGNARSDPAHADRAAPRANHRPRPPCQPCGLPRPPRPRQTAPYPATKIADPVGPATPAPSRNLRTFPAPAPQPLHPAAPIPPPQPKPAPAPTAAGTSDAPKELLRELCDHSRALAFAKLTKRPQRAILGS